MQPGPMTPPPIPIFLPRIGITVPRGSPPPEQLVDRLLLPGRRRVWGGGIVVCLEGCGQELGIACEFGMVEHGSEVGVARVIKGELSMQPE